MITKPTVFVLGAGVSMPYGFPSGKKLVEQIYIATQSNFGSGVAILGHEPIFGVTKIQQILYDIFGRNETERFGDALFLSNQQSIDAFLEHRTEFTDIGKLAIALFVLGNEIESTLFNFLNRDQGCYQYLFAKLNTNWEEFGKNKVAFITFNYDRSLEHFLFSSLQNTYNKSGEDCANQISMIPIIHVHGTLGPLPWQDKNGIQYGGAADRYDKNSEVINGLASRAAKQIKIIPENQKTSEEFADATELLSVAERIYFLGFSYHQTNMIRLGIHKLGEVERGLNRGYSDISRLKGTGLGLETKELDSAKKWFIHIPDTSIDSLLFLRRYADLD